YFTPLRDPLPADLDEIGRRYIGALADEIAKWLQGISASHSPHPGPLPRGEGTSAGNLALLDGHPTVSAPRHPKNQGTILPAHEPSLGARPVPGRSGSDSLLVPEPSPSRRLHSDPLRAGTSRAPDAGGFRRARCDKSSGRSLLGERAVRASVLLTFFPPCERTGLRVTRQQPRPV